ncbi:hypothetical protein IQ249_10550 [Lusitaniella coriacea LEGE 07157]|uniref:HEAT repeat domain-containing protein n=1 Tax=Lusitaniella coriacea LEGE 07157 TaxID=945747 RepID=A0A8J7DWH1_9CYAN|nr:hypothetical protein [Lusitaniella coriacea]MBE9116337.1 hypothetical protein [Lusitaniella coriacea LEGE 07157]
MGTIIERLIASRSTQELIQLALKEEDNDTVWNYVAALQFRGDREVLDAATKLCASRISEERQLGANILGQLGIPQRAFPEDSLAILLEMLEKESDPLVICAIGIALGHLEDARVVEPLLLLKNHLSVDVRFGVVYGLLGQENNCAIAALIQLSSDPDFDVRNWATFGLGSLIEIDTPAIRDALWQRLIQEDFNDSKTYEIYGEALVGLANRKDERIVEPLIKELTSDIVGELAIEAAEAMSDFRLYPALVELQEWWDTDDGALKRAIENCCLPSEC